MDKVRIRILLLDEEIFIPKLSLKHNSHLTTLWFLSMICFVNKIFLVIIV